MSRLPPPPDPDEDHWGSLTPTNGEVILAVAVVTCMVVAVGLAIWVLVGGFFESL